MCSVRGHMHKIMKSHVQWNLSIVDTTEPRKCVLIREVSLFQRLICTQEYTIGTSETVQIREVFLFQRLIWDLRNCPD